MSVLKMIGAFIAAVVIMFLLHIWPLPRFLTDFLPLARGTVAFFLGGAILHSLWLFKVETGRSSAILRLFALALLAVIYIVPFYCAYLRVRDGMPNYVSSEDVAEIRSDGFRGYVHVIGRSPSPINPDDVPVGDSFFDLLVALSALIDQLLQKFCVNFLHLPIAGYMSIGLWYLVFLIISSFGDVLFHQNRFYQQNQIPA